MMDPISAAAAVSRAAQIRPANATAASAGEDDFAAMLGRLSVDSAQTLRRAEAVSIAGVAGQASAQDVAEAVMEAERTLNAAIAIRDKAVAAYLEISRMSI
ncbi:MAG: flagellar hook-basal body complex protein FliE [Hyphomicrobiales bacterium]|nr:flagellar hook-basal body complex protein FliE [Hyphomicrobiales bacterium]